MENVMKKLLFMTALAILFVSAGCNCPCGLFNSEEDAESIVAQMDKAVDVSGKASTINSAVIVYNSHLGKKRNSKVTLKLKKKDKVRLEVRRNNSIMIRACNGKTGWEYVTGKGLRYLKAKELNELLLQATYLAPNADMQKLFTDIKLDGSAKAAGIDCWKLVCTPLAKFQMAPVILFVDKKTFLVVKSLEEVSKDKKKIDITTYMGDYEELDGIMLPFMMVSLMNGKMLESKLVSAKWNADISDAEFNVPEALRKTK